MLGLAEDWVECDRIDDRDLCPIGWLGECQAGKCLADA